MERNSEKTPFLYLYIGSLAFFLSLASVGGYWMGKEGGYLHPSRTAPSASSPSSSEEGSPSSSASSPNAEVLSDMAYVDLPRMTVSVGNGSFRQARVDISLEIARKDIPALQGYMPQIVDKLNTFFPQVKFEGLDDPHTMYVLHKDLLWQLNSLDLPVPVRDLVFRKLIVM
jgi:flagellar basal body-associated protein FliL